MEFLLYKNKQTTFNDEISYVVQQYMKYDKTLIKEYFKNLLAGWPKKNICMQQESRIYF